MRAYTPAQVKANAPVDNKYYPQTTAQYNARLDLTPADNTKVRYNSAAHVMNNFNTINGGDDAAITLNSNRGSEENYSFIGTILAPIPTSLFKGVLSIVLLGMLLRIGVFIWTGTWQLIRRLGRTLMPMVNSQGLLIWNQRPKCRGFCP